MSKIQIYAELESARIFFDNSSVTPKTLSKVHAVVHPTESDRIIISRSDRTDTIDGQIVQRKLFKRLKISRIQNKDGVDLTTVFASSTDVRQAIVDHLNAQFSSTLAIDINVGYKGILDTNTDEVTLQDTGSYNNGDWYWVTESRTVQAVGLNGADVSVEQNDQLRFNGSASIWERIADVSAKVDAIENSALGEFDVYVNKNYAGATSTGSNLKPFTDVQSGLNALQDNQSILIEGSHVITQQLDLPDLSCRIVFATGAEVKYATYNSANGHVFYGAPVLANVRTYEFVNAKIRNAGGYGIYTKKALQVISDRADIRNCGWDGQNLDTVAPETGGVLGYDSAQADLQNFWAGSHTSNGGAIRIQESPIVKWTANTAINNLRGFRFQDCGIGGQVIVTRNISTRNIESGIYLAAGALGGCQNANVAINDSSYNANNGLLFIGGLNNIASQNNVRGNWNAGWCLWGSANATLRDSGLYDNNRSTYNGIGNVGDAKAAIQINDAYNLLGTTIGFNPDARFIAEVLDTQVHYTGLGSNTDKTGLLISNAVGNLAYNDKNLIRIDDVGFIGQDYAIDFSEVNITNLQVSLGDNNYQNIGKKAVKPPLAGRYLELPFSNHVTAVNDLDVVVDTLRGSVALHEGVNGNVINVYNINELQSVIQGNRVDIIQRNSDKIQLRNVKLGSTYVNGQLAGASLSSMNDTLNSAFSMNLVQYKDFVETEVGVEGSTDLATFYYIESPDGTYHYPLFKTEAEANQVDTDLGGAGTSHTHTYEDDLTNTTWYMPNVSNHMSSSIQPVNGVYTAPNGAELTNVVWNIQVTDDDANHLPTFTNITYNVQEGSSINIPYKTQGMTEDFNVTSVPTGYVDNGTAITGTAEDITNGYGQAVQHVIDVTKGNDFGSVQGTITINVQANLAGNEFTIVDQGGVIKFTQDGGITTLDFNTVTFNAGSTYKFYVDGATMQTNDVFDIVDANGNAVTGNDGLSMTGGSGAGYAGTYFQYVIPTDVEPGKFLTFTDGATGTAYPNVPMTIAGSSYTETVTGIALEGPTANQTGTNLFNAAGQHGWLSINEPLGAGQRLVLSGEFLADIADAMGVGTLVSIGLKDGAWANTIGNAVPTGMEGGMMINIYKMSATNFHMYGYNIATGTMTTKVIGTHLYNSSQFLNYNAFIEVTNSGNNIRIGHALTSVHDANTESYENWGSSIKVKSGDQGFGITEIDVMVKGIPLSVDAGITDVDDIDWTALTEVAMPTSAAPFSGTTPYTKAVEFDGSNQYMYKNWNNSTWSTMALHNSDADVDVPTNANGTKVAYADGTGNIGSSVAMAYMHSLVFNCQDVTSNGQPSGSNNDRQYLWMLGQRFQMHSAIYIENDGKLYFTWGGYEAGHDKELRCHIGTLTSDTWYGLALVYTGARLSTITPATMAEHFDIRLTDNFGNLGSNKSIAANWTVGSSASTAMKPTQNTTETIAGHNGSDGSKNYFRGKVASRASTTLRTPVTPSDNPADSEWDMPTDAEIQLFMLDNRKWVIDYRVNGTQDERSQPSGGSGTAFTLGEVVSLLMSQGWEFGETTGSNGDQFPNFYNSSHASVNKGSSFTTMVYNNSSGYHIVNVSIPGLS